MLFATVYEPNAYSAVTALSLAGAALSFSTPFLWIALVEVTPKSITDTMRHTELRRKLGWSYRFDSGGFFTALLAAGIAALIGPIAEFGLIRES